MRFSAPIGETGHWTSFLELSQLGISEITLKTDATEIRILVDPTPIDDVDKRIENA